VSRRAPTGGDAVVEAEAGNTTSPGSTVDTGVTARVDAERGEAAAGRHD
jgi:hypothetical protein